MENKMLNNTKNCHLSFKYGKENYSSNCWNLVQADFGCEAKKHTVIGEAWRRLAIKAGTGFYSLSLTSIMRNNQIYEAMMAISHNKEPSEFSVIMGDRWHLCGTFIISRMVVEMDKFGLVHMKINLESHGEIKNEYKYSC